ncbi:MAG: M20 family metallopeptidase [Chloroflexota bacterium]
MLDFFKAKQDEMVALLTTLIEYETPSHSKPHLDALADYITALLEDMSTDEITRIPLDDAGDIVIGKWNPDAPQKPVVVLMHMDTVWDVGTLEKRPVTIDDEGRLFAPGAVDMKGGLAVAISAVKGLLELNEMPTSHPVWLMFTSDEEVGSNASMPHIEAMAKEAGLILVMEPPAPGGALKTGRKGVATYDIEVIGRASHAGNHPEEGVNAVLELAQQTVAISKLQDLRNGISVAVNTVKGGTATNVIPASAQATVDVRTFKQYDMDYIHEELMGLLPKIPGSQVNVTLHHMRGPMERNDQMIATFEQARAIGKAIDLTITEDTVGGGSDANITASMGVPTLDGLGARGEGLHAEHEHVIIRSLPERAAHLAAILRDWQFGA